ncbi:TPA: glycosyltransferase family 4 protein [Enterococcus faecalis]
MKDDIKVIMIGPGSEEKGGIATVIKNFKRYFNCSNVSITYLTSWKDGNWFNKNIVFVKCCKNLIQEIKKNKKSIIHVHFAQKGSFYRKSILSLFSKKDDKLVFHMHASQFDMFYKNSNLLQKKYISWVLDRADIVVALSKEWANFYTEITNSKVEIIPNAVVIPEKNYYSSSSTNILTFGKVGNRKGSFDILKVAKLLQYNYPKFSFILYGDGELEKVRKIIDKEDIKNVTIGGWISDKESLLKDAAVHFLPSYHEGLPMAVLETMAAGIPNICSKVGGIPQVVNSMTGVLIEPGNIEQMKDVLIKTLLSCEKREMMSKNARQLIKNSFSIDKYHNDWIRIYHHLVDIE